MSLAGVLYKIVTSGALEFNHYKITVIIELCNDTKCRQGIVVSNYNTIIHASRASTERLFENIKELIKKG